MEKVCIDCGKITVLRYVKGNVCHKCTNNRIREKWLADLALVTDEEKVLQKKAADIDQSWRKARDKRHVKKIHHETVNCIIELMEKRGGL